MKLIKQPNKWSCLPTAFAMILDIELDYILRYLGHDGSNIVDINSPEPFNRRSFHIQELQEFIWHHGFFLTPFEANPCLLIKDNFSPIFIRDIKKSNKIMKKLLRENMGVIIGEPQHNKKHAVAWNKRLIYDPNGLRYPLEEFPIETFYIVGRKA